MRVWDLDTGEPVYEPLAGHNGNVLAVAVGQLDGRPIAVSASEDFTVRVWDLAAGEPLGGPLEGHDNLVKAVAVGAAGRPPGRGLRRLRQLVRVWDLATRAGRWVSRWRATRLGQRGGRRGAAMAARSRSRAATTSTVRVWDLAAGGGVGGPLVGHNGWVLAVAVGERGRPIAVSGGLDGTVRVWDLAAGGSLGGPLVHARFVNAVAVGAIGDRSRAASGDARRGCGQSWQRRSPTQARTLR